MIKLYHTFKSPCSLRKPPQTISFTLWSSSVSVSEIVVKNICKHLIFSGSRNSSLTKTTYSCPFQLKKYLIVVNLSHITLCLNHSFMYAVGEETSEPEISYSMKTLLVLLTNSPNARKFCFSLCFLSFFSLFFVFVFRTIETTTANFQGLSQSNPSKNTKRVTLSNKHKNHLFWA